MIRIDRGEEHPELPALRAAELRRVEAVLRARPLTHRDFGEAAKFVRASLRARQHKKCCYCERFALEKHEHVEHVRPKTAARRSMNVTDPGYWWLAWSWDNLLFCCVHCNRHKGTWYPLLRGQPLKERATPPGHERPLLLDPGVDDPIAHIQFKPIAARWIPTPREGSVRGYETIRRIQLDRSDLLEHYEALAHYLDDGITRIRTAGDAVDATWREVLARWLQPSKYLAALYYDILDHTFPRALRTRWGVSLDAFAGALTQRRTGA